MKKIKIKSISDYLKEKIKNTSKEAKLAFIYASLSTFLFHLTFFVNRWANEDDFHYYLGESNMIRSGRWMLGDILSSNFLSPIILLVITMIALGLISVMINKMLKIDKKLYIFITSLLLTTFPVLAMGFGYGFMVERYVMGMFFATFTVYITNSNKFKINPLIGSISLAITMGYYQSYIAISIGLIMIMIILHLFDNKTKDSIKYILRFLIMGIVGVVFYMASVRIICHITGIPLLDYKGINNMGTIPPLDQFKPLLYRTYDDFFRFYMGKKFLAPFLYGRIAQLILCGSLVLLTGYVIFKERVYKNKWNLALIILFAILMPLGLNIVDFVAYESETSSLNIYQFVFIFLIPFILLNRIEVGKNESNFINVFSWISVISGLLLIWNNAIVTNIYYLKINDYYTSTVELTNRMYDRIEQVEGFDGSIPVMVGNKEGIYMDRRVYKDYYKIFLYDQGLWDQFIGYAPRPTGTDFKFHYLVQNIIGVNLLSATPEKFEEIYNSQEYEEMPSWPSKDCMKYIDGHLVVKIS